MDFRGKGWQAGEHISPLQWTPGEEERGDTMVWMSMQLRALKLRFHEFPNPGDIGNPNYQWTHTGSLSSFIESELTDNDEVPLAIRKRPARYSINTVLQGEKSEVERKFGWMTLALKRFEKEFDEIDEFRNLYKKGMDKYVAKFGLNQPTIEGLANAYQTVLGI